MGWTKNTRIYTTTLARNIYLSTRNMFFWFLFWVAVLGAFAVFIDPCIVAGIVAVYIVFTVGWIVASTLIFVAVIFTICFFTACAFRGHPQWIVWLEYAWNHHICTRWPWLPPWIDSCKSKADKCRSHHWVRPIWDRCTSVVDTCLEALNWDVTCDRTGAYVYQFFARPWPKKQKKLA